MRVNSIDLWIKKMNRNLSSEYGGDGLFRSPGLFLLKICLYQLNIGGFHIDANTSENTRYPSGSLVPLNMYGIVFVFIWHARKPFQTRPYRAKLDFITF
ncbi:hypothetical protein ACJX0J_022640, partial [Zea mays]